MRIVVVSGGFDPIHSGHIAMFRQASTYGDKLIVGVNSDNWLTRKKGKPFMNIEERRTIVQSIRWVDEVWEFDDSDDSACDLLDRVREFYWTKGSEFIFANGGDRNKGNVPEANVPGWKLVYGIGGDYKKNSSSWILKAWNE